MKKAIGFNLGQYGDLCVNLIGAKAFKLQYPDYQFTFHIGKPYESIKEIFYNNKYVDQIHISDGYNDWPTKIDVEFINNNKFDIIFNPQKSIPPKWQQRGHHASELCKMHNLAPPDSLQIELNKYFDVPNYKDYIAICYKGTTDSHKKSITDNKLLLDLCNIIESYGLKPLFFQENFLNYATIKDTFFNAIKIMLGCKMLITIDSAMCWIASGYKFPVLGLYNKNYYKEEAGITTSLNWQPINPNAIYLEDEHVNLINIDKIKNSIKNILV
jgi:ADP-heptose:LPS heptosyltransferase